MLFDGFVPLDTRDNQGKVSISPANPTKESSSYGEGTPMPYGPVANPPSAPSTGGSGSGQNLGQYITPGTIIAGAGLLGTFAEVFKKSPEQKTLKAVCGRKPLLNIGGKKDRYLACVDNYLNPQQNVPVNTGMSAGTKALIGFLVVLFLVMIVVVIAMINKNRTP